MRTHQRRGKRQRRSWGRYLLALEPELRSRGSPGSLDTGSWSRHEARASRHCNKCGNVGRGVAPDSIMDYGSIGTPLGGGRNKVIAERKAFRLPCTICDGWVTLHVRRDAARLSLPVE